MPFVDLLRSSQRRNSNRNLPPPQINTQVQPPKDVRRVIGYHNVIHLDSENNLELPEDPPGYDASVFSRRKPRSAPEEHNHGDEVIPHYSCSVSLETAAEVHFEQTTPFESFKKQQWLQVYIVLSGTLLRLHTLKRPSSNLITISTDRNQAGRLIKSYSMQHAEVGIAADEPKQQLIPKSPYIAMLPEAKVEKLKITEPHLFDVVKKYFVRIRVEGEQLLFRLESSEDRSRWIDKLCAAVDIAPPIEDRTEPKYHTLPRRRRRRPPPETTNDNSTAAGPSSPAPAQAPAQSGVTMDLQTGFPILSPIMEAEPLQRVPTATDPDTGDIDESLAFAGAELSEPAPVPERTGRSSLDIRRIFSRRTGTNSSNTEDLASPTSPTRPTVQAEPSIIQPAPPIAKVNTKVPARIYPDDFIKWQPQFYIDSAQQIRYRRHCMPSLLYNSKRANDIVVHKGKRWKIDWDNSRLIPWPETPPGYLPPKVTAPQIERTATEHVDVIEHVDVPVQTAPAHGTATTSLSDAGVSDAAETAATSMTTASQVADSATASIHAGDSNIEGWNWSSSRAKLTVQPNDHPALVSNSTSTTQQEEVPEHREVHITPTTSEVFSTPRSTPHTLRRTGHLNPQNARQDLETPTHHNEASTYIPSINTSSKPNSTDRSKRRSFHLFSRSPRADVASQDDPVDNAGNKQNPTTAQRNRFSLNSMRPFSARTSVDISRSEEQHVSNATNVPAEPDSPIQSRSKRVSLGLNRPFSGRPSVDDSRPVPPNDYSHNVSHDLPDTRMRSTSRVRRLSTTLLQPFSGRTSMDTSRAEVLPAENQVPETPMPMHTQTPPSSYSHRLSTTIKRPFSSRPSMETPRPATEHLDAASPPSSRRSERSSFQLHRPSFDFWRGKDVAPTTPAANPAFVTPSPARHSARSSLQAARPQMSDLVAEKVHTAPASTGRISSWKQRFRKSSSKPPPQPIVQVLPEKNADVFAPHSSYGSAWQSGRVSVVVE